MAGSFSGLTDEFWVGAVGSINNVMSWLSSGNELAAYLSGPFEYHGFTYVASSADCEAVKFAGLWVSTDCASSRGYACEM